MNVASTRKWKIFSVETDEPTKMSKKFEKKCVKLWDIGRT